MCGYSGPSVLFTEFVGTYFVILYHLGPRLTSHSGMGRIFLNEILFCFILFYSFVFCFVTRHGLVCQPVNLDLVKNLGDITSFVLFLLWVPFDKKNIYPTSD